MTVASATRTDRSGGVRGERITAFALSGLLLLATLGEGGGHPSAMMAWHGGLVGMLLMLALLPRGELAAGRSLAAAAAIPFGVFLVLFVLGAARAPYRYGALLVALELGSCVALAWIAAQAGTRSLRSLVTPLQVGAALQGFWVLVQGFVQDRPRPAGTFLNPNHLALWMIAVSLLALGTTTAGDRRSDLWRRLLLALPAAAAVALAGSRGAAVGLAAGAGWLAWAARKRASRRVRVAFVAGVVGVLALVAWRQLDRVARHDPFRYQRVAIWRASAVALAADPWWGTGPGQFATAAANLGFPDGDGPLRFDRSFAATHSDLLRLPTEFGMPAALAALTALGLAVRSVRRSRRTGNLPPAADGAIAALIAIAAQGLVDNVSRWPAVYLLATVLLGCVLAREGPSRPRLAPGLRAALGVALLVVWTATDVAPYRAWRVTQGLPRGRLSDAERLRLDHALRWNPIHPDYRMRLAEHLQADGERWDLETYATAREASEHAVRLHPLASRVQRGVAQLEAHACRTLFRDEACRTRAAAAYRAAERLARHDPFLPLEQAAFLLDTGDAPGARRAAERGLAIEPEAVLARLLLADAFIETGQRGDLSRAARCLAEARALAERWANWDQGRYGRELLQPDPRILERLERKLAAARGASVSP